MANPRKQTTQPAKEKGGIETSVMGGQNAADQGREASGTTSRQNTGTAGQGSGMTAIRGNGGTGTGTATARSLYDQAKETAGQAYDVAAEKASTKLEEQKSNLSGGLATVADSVRKVSDNLRGPDVQDGISKFTAEYSDLAARKIEGVANYFEQKSVREMYSDLENFARRNPAVFIGGAFALGLMAARFLKSGTATESQSQRRLSGNTRTGRNINEANDQPAVSPV